MKFLQKKSILLLFPISIAFFLQSFRVKASWDEGMDLVNETNLPGGGLVGPIWILISFFLWLLKIFIILAIISFVITGITFLFSGMNPDLRNRAKDGLTYSIIAIAVAFSGILVLGTTLAILSGGAFLDYFL